MRFPVCCQHPDPCLPELTCHNNHACGHSAASSCAFSYCCQQPSNSRPIYHQQQHACLLQQNNICKLQQQYTCPQLCRHQPSCQQTRPQSTSNSQAPCLQGVFSNHYPHPHEHSVANSNVLNCGRDCHCQFKSSDVIFPHHRDRSVSSQSLPSPGSCNLSQIRHSGSENHIGANISNSYSTKCHHHTSEIPHKNLKNIFYEAAVTSLSNQMDNTLNCNKPVQNERLLLSEQAVASSGWYYGKLSWREAEVKLKNSKVGCFLLRDSSDPRYSYSLSVQTQRGPTSVRIQRDIRGFSLDSDPGSDPLVFYTIHELLQHYITLTCRQDQQPDPYTRSATVSREHVWLDSSGSVVAAITLKVPLRQRLPSLQHLARMRVNRDLSLQDVCSLPTNLQGYLEQYPFWC